MKIQEILEVVGHLKDHQIETMIMLVSNVVNKVIWLETVLTKIQELKEVELPIDFQIETMIVLASNVANKDI